MRKNLVLFFGVIVMTLTFTFCDGNEIPDPEPPKPPVVIKDSVDIDIDLPFDYSKKDTRPLLQCDTYNQTQKDSLNQALVDAIAKVKGKRSKVVTAATFLVTMSHRVPYGLEWIVADDPSYEFVGRYTKKGLYLNSFVDDKGTTHLPWGCLIKTHPRYPREKVQNLGDYYENGLHCSSYVGWALFNAGAVTNVALLDKTYANEYRKFPGTTEVNLKTGVDLIRPGDLLWFQGHIAIVLAIKGNIVVYGSAEGGSVHPGGGVKWLTFNKKTTDFETFAYKSLIQMSKVYGD